VVSHPSRKVSKSGFFDFAPDQQDASVRRLVNKTSKLAAASR